MRTVPECDVEGVLLSTGQHTLQWLINHSTLNSVMSRCLSCMPPVHAHCLMEEVQGPTTVFGGTFVRSCFGRHQKCSFFRPSGVLLGTTSGTRLDGYILKTSSGKHLLADSFLDKVSQVSSSIMVCGRGVHLPLPSVRRVCFLLLHG